MNSFNFDGVGDGELSTMVIQKYKEIYNNLSTIVNAYEELIILDCNYEPANELLRKKNIYKVAKTEIHNRFSELVLITDKQLLCCHNYIDDYIDTDVERSQKITYCTLCEYTKP